MKCFLKILIKSTWLIINKYLFCISLLFTYPKEIKCFFAIFVFVITLNCDEIRCRWTSMHQHAVKHFTYIPKMYRKYVHTYIRLKKTFSNLITVGQPWKVFFYYSYYFQQNLYCLDREKLTKFRHSLQKQKKRREFFFFSFLLIFYFIDTL